MARKILRDSTASPVTGTGDDTSRSYEAWTSSNRIPGPVTTWGKGMTREIRTPINSIIGMTALLLDENLEQRPREFAAILHQSGIALMNLIESYSGTLKAETNTSEGDDALFDLRQCVADVMEMFRVKANDKRVTLTSQLVDLPKSVIFFDENYVEQVLVNLLSNAVNHTERGSVTLSASCKDLGNGEMHIEFSVADTGKGIPASHLDSIFNPFKLLGENTSRRFKDGVGLPMSKGLTELMGGTIWIESHEDRGTTVWFTIRVHVDQGDVSWDSAGDILANEDTGFIMDLAQRFPHQILVVEDHAINRVALCELLNKMGYQTDEAVDGEEAVVAAMQQTYDLIFMDLKMPSMDGIEATRWIRQRYNNESLRIIAMTGDATKATRNHCLDVGMDHFVPKPIQINNLEEILQQTSLC